MPRRRPKKTRSRSKFKNAYNIKNAAFGYLGASVFTHALFNQNPIQFVMGNHATHGLQAFGPSSGISAISLKEIFQFEKYSGGSSKTLMDQLGDNLKANGVTLIMGMAGLAIGKKLITATGISRNFNSAVRSIGLGSLVKM